MSEPEDDDLSCDLIRRNIVNPDSNLLLWMRARAGTYSIGKL